MNPHGASEIAREQETQLATLCENFAAERLNAFIKQTREQHARLARKLERGHDRLLELNSCRPERAAELIAQIRAQDADTNFEEFFIRLLDHFGVHLEELGNRSYLLLPGHLLTDAFPALPAEGLTVTLDRARALSREDMSFMSVDHPILRGALDLLLGMESGNTAFGIWKNSGAEGILLEICAIAECVAPAALHVDRFLPATPIRIVVDHALQEHTDSSALAVATLEKADIFRLLDRGAVRKKLLPSMLEKAQSLAAERMVKIVETAQAAMEAQLDGEIERLEDLSQLNDHVRPEEITAVTQQKTELAAALATARLRLDAVRLIWRMP
jgi:ATP-dependent helicase HepA